MFAGDIGAADHAATESSSISSAFAVDPVVVNGPVSMVMHIQRRARQAEVFDQDRRAEQDAHGAKPEQQDKRNAP
ncbi:hypothetical protein D3C77_695170 [compost metagenome]